MRLSRRRRGRFTENDRALRAAIGDANLIAWYDARFPWTVTVATGVSAWADARGSGYGPSLVQATGGAQPVYSASAQTITFDGTDDFLRVTSTTFNTVTAACALVVVGTMPSTAGSTERYVSIATAGNASILCMVRDASNGNHRAQADADFVPQTSVVSAAGSRVLHAWRSASSGGDVTVGARLGGGAAGTAVGAAADATAEIVTLGANQAASAAGFGDVTAQAFLVIKGDWTTALQDAVNEWARAVHRATI